MRMQFVVPTTEVYMGGVNAAALGSVNAVVYGDVNARSTRDCKWECTCERRQDCI